MTHVEATTSAFGRRTVTRAQIETQIAVKDARAAAQRRARGESMRDAGQGAPAAPPSAARLESAPGGAVHKWALLRILSEIREALNVSDRTLGVLSALASFHPETALTLDGEPLVVFPSNKALVLRANGMAEPTLRRHLAALVEAGLIIRRDSPNGKRFARPDAKGQGAQVFGFDLSPLVARAGEFEARLETLRAEQRRARFLKERVNLLRRDLAKRIAFAMDEGLAGPWDGMRLAFLRLCTPLRQVRDLAGLAALAEQLDALQEEAARALEAAVRAPRPLQPESLQIPIGNAAQNERHNTESNPHQIPDPEPIADSDGGEVEPSCTTPRLSGKASPAQDPPRELPLALVLEACPDIRDYHFSGEKLEDWRGFIALAATVRPMLGISPDAWREAVASLGERSTAVAIAFILQRCEHASGATRHVGQDGRITVTVDGAPAIRSPGGYLRALAEKSRNEPFSLWSAILGQRGRARRASGAKSAR
ncbi:MAG: replication initiation protein RepC [Methylobacteriaceae bacterium]|nr:replication initiation protein RepC [Methylobacteriaceae bacterium]